MPRSDNYCLQGILAYPGIQDYLIRDGGRDSCHLRLSLFQRLALQFPDHAALPQSIVSKDRIQQEASSQVAAVRLALVLRIYTEIGQLGLRTILHRSFCHNFDARISAVVRD